MSALNHPFRLATPPRGQLGRENFDLVEEPAPDPGNGEALVELEYISLDPAMRGWMNEGRSYVPPVGLGEVMRALALGRVVASRHPSFAAGDLVTGVFGATERALSDGAGVFKVPLGGEVAPETYLGVLGMTGLTAYFGLLDVGRLQEGDTVLVSGAAGAV